MQMSSQQIVQPGTEIYYDPEIHEREVERVFGSAWLFVAHETMLPHSGDFITNYMGNRPVIVVRGRAGEVRVFLNRCPQRGDKLCRYDSGEAGPYEDVGLPEAPRVATYRGLVFATWAADGPSLEDDLGADLRWYLDTLMFDDPEGYEVLPGRHRYVLPGNWKLVAENHGGDMYHFASTHASVMMLARDGLAERIRTGTTSGLATDYYSVLCAGGHPPHGLLQLSFGEGADENDRRQAARLSPAALAWVEERQARRRRLLGERRSRPTSLHTGTIWPNFSFNGFGTALYARTFMHSQPLGPQTTDVWQWALVERSAPAEVKAAMAFTLTQRQAAAGMVAPDDADNFLRMRDVLHTSKAATLGFNYDLGGREKESLMPDLPGCVMEPMNERYQRAFYGYWSALMEYPARGASRR